ncbi:MAG: polysaccharide deacetylase family protein [Prochlorococcus marinus CUG1438]|nr:polysaccharide deacetylase family protein [Prochlorococcus marinus CUG1438]|tara:strand:- start:53 stop:985 length:933 start_codon:yes stop_codon:yes gene_type:complete
MFHHFHDNEIHPKGQGSINKDEFYKIINFVGRKNILDAEVFFDKFMKNNLKDSDVCFTFDDAIKCQIDIALPVLEDLNIKSFFFVYTSIFEGNPDNLEYFRYFRMNYFPNIDSFYDCFYDVLDEDLENFFKLSINKIKSIKIRSPHYSTADIKFRLVRDSYLTKTKYEKIMFSMFKQKGFNYKDFTEKLFFQKNDLKKLDQLGHSIGLHSHNHPTLIENLSFEEQKKEYEACLSSISKILEKPKKEIKYMSHPCGSYNGDTLMILKELGIKLGFKQIMEIEKERGMSKVNNSPLEIARQNHSKIHKEINK